MLFTNSNNLLCVCLVLWPQKDFLYDTFFIDHKRGTVQAHVLSTIQILLAPYAVFVNDLVLRVGKQGKRKTIFFFELLVLLFIIRTDTNYCKVVFL